MIARLNFLSEQQVREIMEDRVAPVYVISRTKLKGAAKMFQSAIGQLPFGGQVKFAMKANPIPEIIKLFCSYGIGVDASSFYEAKIALQAGVRGDDISLTSQELPPTDQDFKDLISVGVKFNATSLHQLSEFLRLFPGMDVGVRLNPGIGSGYNKRLTTGGVAASFGIWYQYIPEALSLAERARSKIRTLHTHIGTGTDPMEWLSALETTLDLVEQLPDVQTVSIGGGFKAAYEPGKKDADMSSIVAILSQKLLKFKQDFGRELKLEIEPGRLLVVHAGSIISKIIDKTDTGESGYNFLRVNTGMGEILRPAMYGAYHQLVVVGRCDSTKAKTVKEFIVAGHCCESSDCLTMASGNPEEVDPRKLHDPQIGDYLVVEQAGAYCYGMSAVGYNSYPAAEVMFVD